MSYTVDIVKGPIPENNKAAWATLEVWRSELYADSGGASPEMRALHDRLVVRYPCITVDEDGPWSDGPLINDFGQRMGIIGVVYSRVEEVLPFVIETSLAMGFTVFDGQDDRIHRPAGEGGGTQKKRPWWRFWSHK